MYALRLFTGVLTIAVTALSLGCTTTSRSLGDSEQEAPRVTCIGHVIVRDSFGIPSAGPRPDQGNFDVILGRVGTPPPITKAEVAQLFAASEAVPVGRQLILRDSDWIALRFKQQVFASGRCGDAQITENGSSDVVHVVFENRRGYFYSSGIADLVIVCALRDRRELERITLNLEIADIGELGRDRPEQDLGSTDFELEITVR